MNREALPTALVDRWPARDVEPEPEGEDIRAFVGISRGVAFGGVVWLGVCCLVWLGA